MRILIIYRTESDYARSVFDYLRDFSRRTSHAIEEFDPDTHEGQSLCRTYDIVEYPTILALADNGQVLGMWRGLPLPTIDEVGYYAR